MSLRSAVLIAALAASFAVSAGEEILYDRDLDPDEPPTTIAPERLAMETAAPAPLAQRQEDSEALPERRWPDACDGRCEDD